MAAWKKKMLSWARPFNIFCSLDNQQYAIRPTRYECLLAAGAQRSIASDDLSALDDFLASKGWKFGHLSYELKNKIYGLRSPKPDPIGFPPFFFFTPKVLLQLSDTSLTIHADDPDAVFAALQQTKHASNGSISSVRLRQKLSREDYLQKITELQAHIRRGDCYEINFCHEFFAEEADVDPLDLFEKLLAVSPNPFSALYRLGEKYLICASPERFLMKSGNTILSQPMKGTGPRNLQDLQEDAALKDELHQSAKDRSENVMVVDIVRNDLSRICVDASVVVEELFGVYSYPQVHQMISSVRGQLVPDTLFSSIIRAMFPMGSMTGAPKYRVLQLIDEYEVSCRGIFSGSVGYITPSGDFDFNVVIRSMIYNAANRYLSYQTGSGITFYSDPEKEWEECLLKGAAIRKVLGGR